MLIQQLLAQKELAIRMDRVTLGPRCSDTHCYCCNTIAKIACRSPMRSFEEERIRWERKIEKRMDAITGSRTNMANVTTSALTPAREPRIGIFLTTWVGDACMATPTLRAIRQQFPAAHITHIGRPVIGELLRSGQGGPQLCADEFLPYSKRASNEAFTRWQLTKQCRDRKFDLVILLPNSFWTAAVGKLSGAKRVVGYDRDGRGWLLTDKVPVPRIGSELKPIPAIDYMLELARWIGCSSDDRRMQLPISESDELAARGLWKQAGFADNAPTVVINSSSATDEGRVWPMERVRELALRTATDLGCQVLLHCGPAEAEMANRIAAEANHPRIASMGMAAELPISLTKAVMRKATAVVTSDSGPRHIAVAYNRPVITLFGSTNVAWTRTYNEPEMAIEGTQMKDITVEDVLYPLEKIMQQSSPSQVVKIAA